MIPFVVDRRPIVERVELRADRLRVGFKLPLLLGGATGTAGLLVTHELPLQIRRRGVERRLIIPGETAVRARVD